MIRISRFRIATLSNPNLEAAILDLLHDLQNAALQKIIARHVEEVKMEIHREEISLADMIKSLKSRIFQLGEMNVLTFFDEMHSKRELVTAFIAVLEIVRTESVKLMQNTTFGDIILRKVEAQAS